MTMRKILSLILAAGICAQMCAANAYAESTSADKIYVNGNYAGTTEKGTSRQPYKTVEKAKSAAFGKLSDNDVEILITKGTYFLDEAIDFNSADMPITDHSLTVKPRNDGDTVIISGGERLIGFTLYDAEKNIYRTPYKSTIQRQLYVNGTPAVRSRSTDNDLVFSYPQGSADINEDGVISDGEVGTLAITTTNTDVANWNIANIAEIVFKNSFVSPRKFITGVTVENGIATFGLKNDTYRLEQAYKLADELGGIFYLENALEVLDEPGEWCHDGEYIYYMPRDGEDMTETEIILPKQETPVSFVGTAAKTVKNITLKGITFSHNTWLYPSTSGELIPAQSNIVQGQPEVPGLVNTKYAENIVFDGCTFTNGGGSGIDILEGSKNITVTGCEISNISSAGILIGSTQSSRYGKEESKLIRNITVEQNKIHDCAIDYYSATGIAVAYEKDIKIVHNEIYNLPYSGIHIGYGWNYGETSDVEGIDVKYNYIHDCMTKLHDGGLIYTLGATCLEAGAAGKRNEIAYNYLKDAKNDGAYIYHDNGSTYWNTHHNVINQTDSVSRPWCNTAPDTNNISVHYNYTNITSEATTTRVNDALLLDMFKNTNFTYSMNDSGAPQASGYRLDCAYYVVNNAGCADTVLYDIAAVKDGITLNNAVFLNDDILIYNGGSATIDTAMKGGAFNFKLYAGNNSDGSYELSIDDTYRFVVTKTDITFYENDRQIAKNGDAPGWSSSGYTDVTVAMTDTGIRYSYGNLPRIVQSYAAAAGKIKIKVNGMSAVIGSLPKHYSVFANDLELYNLDIKKNIAPNGYFESDISGWSGNGVDLSRDTENAYGESLASLKVAEKTSLASAAAETTVSLAGGKWYRVSAMIKPMSGNPTARFTSSDFSASIGNVVVRKDPNDDTITQTYANLFKDNFFGKEFSLNSGWNLVTDYVMVDTDTDVTLEIAVSGKNTYYVDNFEVVEETPTLTEYGFENGLGCWLGTSANAKLSVTDNGFAGKAMCVETSQYAYNHAVRPIHLKAGKTYKARAKIYIDALNDSSESAEALFSVHQYYNYVNAQDQYGYKLKDVPVGQWTDMEFTFTWKATDANAPAFIKMKVGKLGRWYVDDVELYEVSEQKVRTENSDFTRRMAGWEYSGINTSDFIAGEGVKLTSANGAVLSQEINMLSGMDYYAECYVKLENADEDSYTLADILITDKTGKALAASSDFEKNNSEYRSKKQAITADRWTKIGGIIGFDADSIATAVKVSAEVTADDGTVPQYRIKGLRLVPINDLSTTLGGSAISDGKVTYDANGAAGSKIRYSYYKYDNGWVKSNCGYVNIGETLPEIGEGKAYAIITSTAANGADEITEIAETTEILTLSAIKSDNTVSVKTAVKNPLNKRLIIGIYSQNGEILEDCGFLDTNCGKKEFTLGNAAANIEVKAFVWDTELLKPVCDALSATAK